MLPRTRRHSFFELNQVSALSQRFPACCNGADKMPGVHPSLAPRAHDVVIIQHKISTGIYSFAQRPSPSGSIPECIREKPGEMEVPLNEHPLASARTIPDDESLPCGGSIPECVRANPGEMMVPLSEHPLGLIGEGFLAGPQALVRGE